MKRDNTILTLFCCLAILLVCIFDNRISSKLAKVITENYEVQKLNSNNYTKNHGYEFVNLNNMNEPLSYNDLINIIYSVINSKETKYTFYCPDAYTKCLKDIEKISDSALLLTHLNNFIHPFNSFTNLKTTISETGEINLSVTYLYSEDDIKQINEKADLVINELITDDMNDYDKIKAIHDYIANNTHYDVERNEKGTSNYDSFKANGPLLEGYATCNGYADAMAIFLNKLGFDNFKIATTPEEISYESTGHVWNAVYYNNEWVHLDLTWDDPVSDDGKDYLYHKYFLVNNEELLAADNGDVSIEEHNFDKSIYLELNKEF